MWPVECLCSLGGPNLGPTSIDRLVEEVATYIPLDNSGAPGVRRTGVWGGQADAGERRSQTGPGPSDYWNEEQCPTARLVWQRNEDEESAHVVLVAAARDVLEVVRGCASHLLVYADSRYPRLLYLSFRAL